MNNNTWKSANPKTSSPEISQQNIQTPTDSARNSHSDQSASKDQYSSSSARKPKVDQKPNGKKAVSGNTGASSNSAPRNRLEQKGVRRLSVSEDGLETYELVRDFVHPENSIVEKSNEIYFTFTNNPDEAVEVMGVLRPDSEDAWHVNIEKVKCRLIAVRIIDYLNLQNPDGYEANYVKTLEQDTATDEPTEDDLINFNCRHLRWISEWANKFPSRKKYTQEEKIISKFVNFVLEFWFRQASKIQQLTPDHYKVLYQWLHVFDYFLKPDPTLIANHDLKKYVPSTKIDKQIPIDTIKPIKVYLAIALNLLAKEKLDKCSFPGQVDNPLYDINIQQASKLEIAFKLQNGIIHLLANKARKIYEPLPKSGQKSITSAPIKAWEGGGPIQYEVELTDNAADSIKANQAIRIDGNQGEASFQVEDLYLVAIRISDTSEAHFVSSINHYKAKKAAAAVEAEAPYFEDQVINLDTEIKEGSEVKAAENKIEHEKQKKEKEAKEAKEEQQNIENATKAAQEYLDFEISPQTNLDEIDSHWWRFARKVFEKIVFNTTAQINSNVLIDDDKENVILLFDKAYMKIFNIDDKEKLIKKYNKYFSDLRSGSSFIRLVKPIIINAIKVLFGKKIYRFNTDVHGNTAKYQDSVDNTIATALLSSVKLPDSTRQIFLKEPLDLYEVLPELNNVFISFKQKQREQNKLKGGMSFGGTVRKRRGLLSKTIRRERK